MILTIQDIIYLISNIFGTYILYMILHLFYEYREYNKKIELASYVLYFIITTCIHILFNSTIFSHAIYLVLIPFITLNYVHYKKLRIKALAIILGIYLIIELAAYFSIRIFCLANKDVIVLVASKMAAFIAMVVLKRSIEENRGRYLLFGFMISMPIGTSYVLYLLLLSLPASGIIPIVGSAIIYLLNFCVFILYEKVTEHSSDDFYKKLYENELKDTLRLKRIVYDYQEECNRIHKEFKQNMHKVLFLFEINEFDKALKCLKSTFETNLNSVGKAYSGNKEIDKILNFELNNAAVFGIEVKMRTILPREMEEELVNDLNIILRNLIKNAMVESLKVDQAQRKIRIIMDYNENTLQLSIAHSCKSDEKNNKPICIYDASSRVEDNKQIYGLNEIIEVIKKYNTYLTVTYMDTRKDAYLSIKVPYNLV